VVVNSCEGTKEVAMASAKLFFYHKST